MNTSGIEEYQSSFYQVSRNLLSLMEEEALEAVRVASAAGGGARARRPWDDDFVLKRQFSALIPAFDPRPGRTNLNQTVGELHLLLWYLTGSMKKNPEHRKCVANREI